MFGLLEQLDRLQQQVVEVERVRILQRLQVHAVQLADLLVARVPRGVRGEDLRPFHAVLRVADARQRQPRLHAALSSTPSCRSACLMTVSWSVES